MADQETIRYEDAAEVVTVIGWACKTCRRWWGDDEHLARWCCATDLPCECGGRKRKTYTVCAGCRERKAEERWAARERREWDGELPLFAVGLDEFVFDEDRLVELVHEHGDGLRLLFCRPVYAREVEADLWYDDLPEDWDLDSVPWLADAVDALNETIRAKRQADEPVSWRPGDVVAVVEGVEHG